MRKALGDKSAELGRWPMWAAPAVAVAIVLLLIGAGGYALLRHMVEQGVHQAELKWEGERRAIELEANRKVGEAEQQRLAALNAAAQERQARAAAEAEAKRKATEAEQQRLAAVKAEQERQASAPAQERQARAAAEAEAKRATESEQQRLAAVKAEFGTPKPKTPPSPPEFPWPPPTASASYVLPKSLFENRGTIGEVVAAIISALERNGYVERSFFRIEAGGVALVTRLERIRDDGSSFVESQRWPAAGQGNNLSGFLRGLFFVAPGHYRVIVFILRGN
jgi:hypothetical protein